MSDGIRRGIEGRPEIQIGVRNAVTGAFDAVSARLKKLLPGAKKQEKKPAQIGTISPEIPSLSLEQDWRVRISVPPGSRAIWDFGKMYASTEAGKEYANVLAPLMDTSGVVFPYTPNIQLTHSANYSPLSPTHSNYQSYFYNNSQVSNIAITTEFTAQTQEQAKYVLAMIYFFRAATKMFYGQSNNQGSPPPILYLDGYGDYYFPHVPVVISNFTHVMPNDVDYIRCDLYSKRVITNSKIPTTTAPTAITQGQPGGALGLSGQFFYSQYAEQSKAKGQSLTENITIEDIQGGQWVPTSSQVTLELIPMYSRRNVSENFSWEKFARGELLANRGGFL